MGEYIGIVLSWGHGALQVAAPGMAVGFLIACGYLLWKRELKKAAIQFAFAVLCVFALLVGIKGKGFVAPENWRNQGELIGKFFPGALILFLVPEPLRRAKRYIKKSREKYGERRRSSDGEKVVKVKVLPSRRQD